MLSVMWHKIRTWHRSSQLCKRYRHRGTAGDPLAGRGGEAALLPGDLARSGGISRCRSSEGAGEMLLNPLRHTRRPLKQRVTRPRLSVGQREEPGKGDGVLDSLLLYSPRFYNVISFYNSKMCPNLKKIVCKTDSTRITTQKVTVWGRAPG